MEFSVEGVIPGDKKKYKAMQDIADKCEKMGVHIPKEVTDYLDEYGDDAEGRSVDLDDTPAVEIQNPDGCDYTYWAVDLRKLDPEIKIIRFRVSS